MNASEQALAARAGWGWGRGGILGGSVQMPSARMETLSHRVSGKQGGMGVMEKRGRSVMQISPATLETCAVGAFSTHGSLSLSVVIYFFITCYYSCDTLSKKCYL